MLRETIKPLTIVGILLSLSGPLLIVLKESTSSHNGQAKSNNSVEVDRRTLGIGILYGAGTAVCWGISPILIKLGLERGGSPVFGNLVMYLAACIVILPSAFLIGENRKAIFNIRQEAFWPAVFCGLANNVWQLSMNFALAYGSVIVVSLMVRTSPIWTLLFAFFFIRRYESLSRWVLLGNGLVIIGSLLVLVP
jgi:drug/metabolite transporter (DMT)-like permease